MDETTLMEILQRMTKVETRLDDIDKKIQQQTPVQQRVSATKLTALVVAATGLMASLTQVLIKIVEGSGV